MLITIKLLNIVKANYIYCSAISAWQEAILLYFIFYKAKYGNYFIK